MIDLSIIIVSYNTAQITKNCIKAIIKLFNSTLTKPAADKQNNKITYEIIVIDNNSSDNTIKELSELRISELKVVKNQKNVGFAKANNQGIKISSGKYILFINSDVVIGSMDFLKLLKYMEIHPQVGVLTVKLILPNGKIDPACHRGFPTLWRSFCYFSGLEKLFEKVLLLNKIFGGYHLIGIQKENIIHEIDSPSGAFYLTRRDILIKIKGFDERFFMYGEDLDLSYQVKKLGYKIIFYPDYEVLHLKYQSGLKGKDKKHQKMIKNQFYQAMKLFYQKNYSFGYPKSINSLVYLLIDLKNK